MFAVRNFVVLAALLSTNAALEAAEPRFIASGGRQGYYWEAFLISDKDAGIGGIREVEVRFISNEGKVRKNEFLTSCSPGNGHVVNSDNERTDIDVKITPSQSQVLEYEVWYASCRKQFGKFSERGTDERRKFKYPTSKFVFPLDGNDQVAEVINDPELAPMRGLLKIDIQIATRRQRVVLYCSRSVPTVYWPLNGKKVEISDANDERERKGAELVSRSLSIWQALCNPMAEPPGNGTAPPPVVTTPKVVGGDRTSQTLMRQTPPAQPTEKATQPSASAPVTSAPDRENLKALYQLYMFRTRICDIVEGYAHDQIPVKRVMSQVEELAKKRGLKTETIWQEAADDLYKADFGPQLKMIEEVARLGGFSSPSERAKAASTCNRASGLVIAAAADVSNQWGGNKLSPPKKDF